MLWSKQLGKTHIPERKNTAAMPAVAMPTPKEVLIPMLQHIGAPATPIVKIGDLVKVGQKIGEAQGFVSSPVHASVSGKVTKIENYLRPDGKVVPAVRILSDGEMTVSESIAPPWSPTSIPSSLLSVSRVLSDLEARASQRQLSLTP